MKFAPKINKIPEFCMIFARKMPKFYIMIARKSIFPEFFFWGGGARALPALGPLSPSPTPMHKAEVTAYKNRLDHCVW